MPIQPRATLEDVARLAGVSSKTVSRVYADRDLVAPDTVERVLAAAKRLRFRPNTLARTLRRGGTAKTVGFVIGELGNPFYYKVAAGLEAELKANGFNLLVATTDDTPEGEEQVADALLSQRIAALVLIPVGADQAYLEGERQLGTPVVTIDRPARNLVADSIVVDNRTGAREAARHLLALGHTRIAYACNPADVYTQAERVAGFREAMAAHGVADTAGLEHLVDDRSVPPDATIGAILDAENPPTAIIAGNNRMTVGALRALRARGDRDGTALIGFDDFDTADVLGVSVVSYDPVEMGRRAAQTVIERVAEPTGFTHQVTMPTWLIERGSGERRPARKERTQ